jgi:hypothetical protein
MAIIQAPCEPELGGWSSKGSLGNSVRTIWKNKLKEKEVGNWIKQNFFKGRSPNGQKHMKKMLTIPGHNRNANQNHTKIRPHPC